MEIQIAVAKVNMYGSEESGDSLEVVERPSGGISVVLADGRFSGKVAKSISTLVVRRMISLLAEGVRDGAAARAASDALYTERMGQATAYLSVMSADLQTDTIVITRNNTAPIFVAQRDRVECLGSETEAIGTSKNIRPAISEIPLEVGTTVVMYTDGLSQAGVRIGQTLDICMLIESMLEDQEPDPQEIADTILTEGVRLDQGRPNDDMSIVVLRVIANPPDQIRRMSVRIPVIDDHESGPEKAQI
jgi:serine phosphatase RsbU (regulator of sigma subunit)